MKGKSSRCHICKGFGRIVFAGTFRRRGVCRSAGASRPRSERVAEPPGTRPGAEEPARAEQAAPDRKSGSWDRAPAAAGKLSIRASDGQFLMGVSAGSFWNKKGRESDSGSAPTGERDARAISSGDKRDKAAAGRGCRGFPRDELLRTHCSSSRTPARRNFRRSADPSGPGADPL